MEIVKIKSIKKLDKKYDRYDLTVLSTNNFFANSILIHNTSSIYSNVKTRVPIKLPVHQKLWNWLIDNTGWFKSLRITDYTIEYGNIYSSRTVIKNQYINKDVNGGYYGTDVWAEYNELLKDKIDKGMTVYGEIIGYISGSQTMIQKQYDYGCEVGTNKFMPYRITTEDENGKKHEWDVSEVKEWTEQLIKKYPDIKERIHVIDILYNGTLKDLYPQFDVTEHWHENVLEALKNDKEHLGMELNEPLCKAYKVPREGIVIRIDGDPVAEAFKLKTDVFYGKEQKEIDAGNVDIEMERTYCEN